MAGHPKPATPPKRPLPDYILTGDAFLRVLGLRVGRAKLGTWLGQRRRSKKIHERDLQRLAIANAICAAVEDLLGDLWANAEKRLRQIITNAPHNPPQAAQEVLAYVRTQAPEADSSRAPVLEALERFVKALFEQSIVYRGSSPRRTATLKFEPHCAEAKDLCLALEGKAPWSTGDPGSSMQRFRRALGDEPARWVAPLRAYPIGIKRLLHEFGHELQELGYATFANQLAEVVLFENLWPTQYSFDEITIGDAFEHYIFQPLRGQWDPSSGGDQVRKKAEHALTRSHSINKSTPKNPIISVLGMHAELFVRPRDARLIDTFRTQSLYASKHTKNPGYHLAAEEFTLDLDVAADPDVPAEDVRAVLQSLAALDKPHLPACRIVRVARKRLHVAVSAVENRRDPYVFRSELTAALDAAWKAQDRADKLGEGWCVEERHALGAIVRDAGSAIELITNRGRYR